jgi:S-adenosylmethionine-diacylgycerolhomoserine-N-methlytransferase
MLATAAASTTRARAASRIALARADATAFDPQALFGSPCFERVMISYALSMIPPWRAALAQAFDVLAPGGSLQIVDFGDCAGLPGPFKAGLRRWLAMFEVTPRDDLSETLATLAAERGMTCETEPRFRGYAVLAVARAPAPVD